MWYSVTVFVYYITASRWRKARWCGEWGNQVNIIYMYILIQETWDRACKTWSLYPVKTWDRACKTWSLYPVKICIQFNIFCDMFFMSHLVWLVGHYVSGFSVRLSIYLPIHLSVRPSHFTATTLRAAANPANATPFRQIIMYVLQCPHDVHVHLFCFDLDLHKLNLFLLRSCVATCPTSNCGCGTSLLRQELVKLGIYSDYSKKNWSGTPLIRRPPPPPSGGTFN